MGMTSTARLACGLSALTGIGLSLPAIAQELPAGDGAVAEAPITVNGTPPADLTGLAPGPELTGIISARRGDRMQITDANDSTTVVALSEATEVRGRGGFLGLNRTALGQDALLNGLPVTIETVQWGEALIASRVRLRSTDLRTASMIRSGTAQGFAEQTAATAALRGRVANIDQYNVRRTTNVYFDTAQHRL